VFVGGWTLEAAEAVCAGAESGETRDESGTGRSLSPLVSPLSTLDGLASLVDNSLVREEETAGGEPRFSMLETIREFALERLVASGEGPGLRRRHAQHYLALAEEAEPKLAGVEQAAWLERLETEHDNLRAALGWSGSDGESPEIGLRLAGALLWFWYTRGHFAEGRRWLMQLLAAGADAPAPARAKALNAAGNLAREQGEYREAAALHEEALAAFRALDDTDSVAWTLGFLGLVSQYRGEYERTMELHAESLALFRQVGDRQATALALYWLGFAARAQGRHEQAERHLEESLSIFRAVGDDWGVSRVLTNLGCIARARGDHQRAASLHEESLALGRELGDKRGIAVSLHDLGRLAAVRGDEPRAAELLRESLALRHDLGDRLGIAECLEALAESAVARGHPAHAARLFGAAEALRAALGAPLPPVDRPIYERQRAAAQAALGDEAFTAGLAEGRAPPLAQAVAEAQHPPDTPPVM
jgi:tetratricopeptide (TPR) repeat protein